MEKEIKHWDLVWWQVLFAIILVTFLVIWQIYYIPKPDLICVKWCESKNLGYKGVKNEINSNLGDQGDLFAKAYYDGHVFVELPQDFFYMIFENKANKSYTDQWETMQLSIMKQYKCFCSNDEVFLFVKT